MTQFELAMPIKQTFHEYPDPEIKSFLGLHFPSNPEHYKLGDKPRFGRTLLGFHRAEVDAVSINDIAHLDDLLETAEEIEPEDIDGIEPEDIDGIELEDHADTQDEADPLKPKKRHGLYNVTRMDITQLGTFVPEMHISRNLDYYIMANAVKGVHRCNDEIFAFHNLVIDIDCHGIGVNPSELAQKLDWRLKRDYWDTGDIPVPNSVVKSGRGLQLWWAIDPMPAKQAWKYRQILDWLMDHLQDFIEEYPEDLAGVKIDRAASKRLAGWFRMPLTWNTKTRTKGKLEMLRMERYSHHAIYKQIPNGYKSKKEEKKRKVIPLDKTTVHVPLAAHDREILRGGSNSMALRVAQLCRLRAYRKKQGIHKGEEMRDRFCFTVFCSLLTYCDLDEAWNYIVAFNNDFDEPYPDDKLAQILSTAERKGGYKLTNDWLVTALEMTPEEQDHCGIHGEKIERKKRKKQNYARDYIRQTRRTDRDNKVWTMWQEGYNKSEIARIVGISRNTVTKIINEQEAACEAEAVEEKAMQEMEQAAAGAENPENRELHKGEDCSKTVLNKYCLLPNLHSAVRGPGIRTSSSYGIHSREQETALRKELERSPPEDKGNG